MPVNVLPPPRLEGAYQLADGRRIGFCEYGTADGEPILWFHGTPGGSRQIAPVGRRAAGAMGIRLIALDRPGIGASTAHVYRNVLGWADDVESILDGLGIDRYAVVALSGGGPYALACAARHPRRLTGAAILGGVAPTVGPDRIGGGLVGVLRSTAPLLMATRVPAGRALHLFVRASRPVSGQVFELFKAISPEGDQRVFSDPDMKAMFIEDILVGTRNQAVAPILDLVQFSRDWGFRLGDITIPVRLWQGDADHIVPVEHARHLAARLPDSQLRIRLAESHLGVMAAAEEIFGVLLHERLDQTRGAHPRRVAATQADKP
jgi:pimeloyl-ACP methyl ester carboxylesterase